MEPVVLSSHSMYCYPQLHSDQKKHCEVDIEFELFSKMLSDWLCSGDNASDDQAIAKY